MHKNYSHRKDMHQKLMALSKSGLPYNIRENNDLYDWIMKKRWLTVKLLCITVSHENKFDMLCVLLHVPV